jgi:hypothetical protein
MAQNWTAEDLAAIEAAIAKGALIVKYSDKEIRYRSLSEMLQIRDLIRVCLGLDSRGARRVASTDKGFC